MGAASGLAGHVIARTVVVLAVSGIDQRGSHPGPLSPWDVVLAWVLLLALLAGLATIVAVWTLRHGGGIGLPQPRARR